VAPQKRVRVRARAITSLFLLNENHPHAGFCVLGVTNSGNYKYKPCVILCFEILHLCVAYYNTHSMIIFRLLPVLLSFLLIAAHFSRADQKILVIISLAIPFLLLIKKRVIIRIMQIVLLLAAAEWIRSMLIYIEVRKISGDDWTRLAIILSVVAIYTAASGLFLQNRKIMNNYKS
jgi:hypothetical protein